MAQRIAVVDDEEGLREALSQALSREGFEVECFADGQQAWEGLRERMPDLAVLDILMPGLDGRELCRRLRQRSEEVPILFLSSRDEELDRVLGLELGADDYLGKPFSMRELLARVRVLLRRCAMQRAGETAPAEARLRVDALELDLQRYTASWDGDELPLTVTEFRLLRALARRPGHVKTRDQLMEEAYPEDAYVCERSIDSHIKRMRRKLHAASPTFRGIETVHGLGYRFHPRPPSGERR